MNVNIFMVNFEIQVFWSRLNNSVQVDFNEIYCNPSASFKKCIYAIYIYIYTTNFHCLLH